MLTNSKRAGWLDAAGATVLWAEASGTRVTARVFVPGSQSQGATLGCGASFSILCRSAGS